MRSSKSRSRNKANRPRTLGNIVNRVFDSSGPEGKVRGTPQQIIEKYLFLARDAQLGNDRVAAENFLQHAEHYTRMLAEAQREMAAEQEERQRQYGQNGNQNVNQNGGQNGAQYGNQNGNQNSRDGDERETRGDRPQGADRDQNRDRDPNRDQNRDRQPGFRDRRDDRRDRDQNREPNRDQRTPAAMEVVEAVDDGDIFAPAAVVPDFPQRDDLPAFLSAPLEPLPPLADPEAEPAAAQGERKPRSRAPRKPKAESPETAG